MTWEDYANFKEQLKRAVDGYDRPAVEQLVDDLIDHLRTVDEVYPADEANLVLGLLRRKRFFAPLERAADAFIRSGQDTPKIRRQHAQALLDQGKLTAGIAVIKPLLEATADDDAENAEARGLLGRANKQAFIDAGTSATKRSHADLDTATRWYYDVYDGDPGNIWHGINAVALLMRGYEEGFDLVGFANPNAMAKSILQAVKDRDSAQEATMWDFGTALEACVAIGDNAAALGWARKYVSDNNADAFELASTLRQLEEVWQLTPDDEPGKGLIPLLRATLLEKEGGRVDFAVAHEGVEALAELAQDGDYEAVLGAEAFQSVVWLQTAFDRAKSVALVTDAIDDPHGTAFVVRAGDFGQRFGPEDELLLLTNSHVVSKDVNEAAVQPENARFKFELDGGGPDTYQVKEIVWNSPQSKLDATLIRTHQSITKREPMPMTTTVPVTDSRVYIVGHPSGRKLSFSIYDNQLLNHADPFLHYLTPTEGGSSGSPVLNRQWQTIGLHHLGNRAINLPGQEGTTRANEGITMGAIMAKMEEGANGGD